MAATHRVRRYVPAAPRIDALDDRFADNLRTIRTARKISRPVLAEKTGIPRRTIENIETGHGCPPGRRRRVTIGEAVVLAEALGVKPGELLRGAE